MTIFNFSEFHDKCFHLNRYIKSFTTVYKLIFQNQKDERETFHWQQFHRLSFNGMNI